MIINNYTKVDNITIHYITNVREELLKEKPIILFIHGLGCSAEYWYYIFHSKSTITKNYNLIALDLVGFGESDKPKNYDYSLIRQALLTYKFIDHLNFEVDVLVGFSMGGPIALYLSKQLHSFKRLILIEPVLFPSDLSFSKLLADHSLQSIKVVLFFLRLFPRFIASSVLFTKNKLSRSIVKKAFLQTNAYVLKKAGEGLVNAANDKGLYQILKNLPVVKDYFIGSDLANSANFSPPEDLFAVTNKYLIENSKHALMLDRPDLFIKRLNEALSTNYRE